MLLRGYNIYEGCNGRLTRG